MAATAASTLAIVSSLTGAERLSTADTVEMATPARFATSLIVAKILRPPLLANVPTPCQIYETFRVCKILLAGNHRRDGGSRHRDYVNTKRFETRRQAVADGANRRDREEFYDEHHQADAACVHRGLGRDR